MVKRVLSIAAVIMVAGALSVSTATAAKKSTFSVTGSNTGNCEVTATATWSGARVLEVDYALHVGDAPNTQTYQRLDPLTKAQCNGTSSVIINTENAGNATVDATFLRTKKTVAGTATSASFVVNCT